MTDEPERLDLRSHDLAADKREELLRLFPEVRTEGGQIDFDRLRLALGETVDVGKERYGLTWPGKADCFKAVQTPTLATLRPCPEESVNFDSTEHLIIEGDNLEVLKLLQKSYLGRVKMIYIDPPYNTGNDFIYPDDYADSLRGYLSLTGQVDDTGRALTTNTTADGRFHSKWLSMMYSRLYLARNLLCDAGVIFISIDDRESSGLRGICNEVFSEENFIADVAVVNNLKGRQDKRYIAQASERVLMYVKTDLFAESGLDLPEERLGEFDAVDEIGRYRLLGLRKRGGADTRRQRPKMFYPFFAAPEGGALSLTCTATHSVEILPRKSDNTDGCWRWGPDTAARQLASIVAVPVGPERRLDVFEKDYLEQDGAVRRIKPKSVMAGTSYSTDGATKAFRQLLPDVEFPNPKPVPFIQDLVGYSTVPGGDEIVLDFFAGSGTTAHAVLEQNGKDGGNRKFILVQLPEPTGREDYPTIADITKERVRRVIGRLAQRTDQDQGGLFKEDAVPADLGFRVFKLAESNFTTWDADAARDEASLARQLELHTDHIREGRTDRDLLFEVVLKDGFALTARVETLTLAGKTVYSVADGGLLLCLERELTLGLVRAIAEQRPERVVCLDEGFTGNDQLKANAVQIFRGAGVVRFKTV